MDKLEELKSKLKELSPEELEELKSFIAEDKAEETPAESEEPKAEAAEEPGSGAEAQRGCLRPGRQHRHRRERKLTRFKGA